MRSIPAMRGRDTRRVTLQDSAPTLEQAL